MIHHIHGIVDEFSLKLFRHLLTSLTGNIGLAGSISPGIKGCRIGILCGFNINIFESKSGGLRCHLREYRIRSLSDFRCPHKELCRTVLVQYHTGRSRLQRNGVHTGLIAENSHTNPSTLFSALRLIVLRSLFLPVNELRTLFHSLL